MKKNKVQKRLYEYDMVYFKPALTHKLQLW